MPRFIRLFLFGPLLLAACGQGDPDAVILAPASMEDVLAEIEGAYEAEGNPPIDISYAGTSTHARQVERGAPADLFLSADTKWMDELSANGFVQPQSVRDVAAGELVLILPGAMGSERGALDSAALTSILGNDGRLAVADMAAVPAGRYASEALAWLKAGEDVLGRAVETENVRATLRLVEAGEAAAGIVYATDARASKGVHIAYRFPADAHPPIRYQAGLVGDLPGEGALAFLDYLDGERARNILADYGFLPARTDR